MSSENEINKLRQNLNKGTDLYMNKPNKNQKHSNGTAKYVKLRRTMDR